MWEIDYLTASGRLDANTAELLEELAAAPNSTRASDLALLLESRVAPVSGGLANHAADVLRVVFSALPWMTAEAREHGLTLVTHVAGTAAITPGGASDEVGEVVSAALPLVAEIAARGTDSEVGQCIDLLSLAAAFGEVQRDRIEAYLRTIATSADDPEIQRSAQQEIEEINQA